MDIRKLQRAIVDGLEDVKGHDIKVFNTEHLSPLFERVIIASGTSNRQTKALAASVRDAVKSRGMQVLRTEGQDNGEWIIVDCGAAVAHIMQPAIRDYYHLEEIWGDKPVRMKIDGAAKTLPKASAPAPVPAAAPGRTRLVAAGGRGAAQAAAWARPASAPARPPASRPASPSKRPKAAPAASSPRSRGAKGAVTSITGTARGGSSASRKSAAASSSKSAAASSRKGAAAASRKDAVAAPRKSAAPAPRKPARKPSPKR
jgi:ribosome-associated protein